MGSALALLHAPSAVVVAGSLTAAAVMIALGRPRTSPAGRGLEPSSDLVQAHKTRPAA